jgi:hypothetical protein
MFGREAQRPIFTAFCPDGPVSYFGLLTHDAPKCQRPAGSTGAGKNKNTSAPASVTTFRGLLYEQIQRKRLWPSPPRGSLGRMIERTFQRRAGDADGRAKQQKVPTKPPKFMI